MPFVTGPKEKKSRALGENLFLKAERSASPKSAMIRRPYPPGMHGKRRRNISEFGTQLKEKQKIKLFYGLENKQIKRYAEAARKSQKLSAPEVLFRLLEMRIDNALYQSGIAVSRSIARQMISHGHLALKGRKVNIPSISLKIGDEVSVVESSKSKNLFEGMAERFKKRETPTWLQVDAGKLSFKVVAFPSLDEAKTNFNLPLVIEYFSR
ncbi:MAG: 30S ribosomal protein S4 [Parcubacteria group bacterium GW2011_GWC1_45_9]|nr:MAG: 30S ribosomal protein S4 [Parcubacteria group bacterium GW2011_GWA1_Parcubacteria_45_10]KKT89300.1 MAG: 30S ribosomal protein S4 [Parcubacteria group bacterium GW2011_GWB1_45_10]KKU17116.1 MAG: 30S ribosomal protein S4 [Parcubacteria group bacterium GW2011_GWC1_45_9]HCI05512.1 30S ribosomal protein S4 [Patescibacteria group bacterium]